MERSVLVFTQLGMIFSFEQVSDTFVGTHTSVDNVRSVLDQLRVVAAAVSAAVLCSIV